MEYKLYYFNTMTLAEPIRLIFAAANVEYEDIRIEKQDWPKYKTKIPWGKVPALELSDGTFLCQSTAIIRYLAKKYDMIGDTDLEAAKCDEIAGAVADLQREVLRVFQATNEETKAVIKNKMLTESFPKYCNTFIAFIKANGTGYLVGKRMTYADILLAYIIGQLCKILEPKLLKNYPELANFQDFINDHPGIKEWIRSRPQTSI